MEFSSSTCWIAALPEARSFSLRTALTACKAPSSFFRANTTFPKDPSPILHTIAKLSRFNDSLSPSDSDCNPCNGWCLLCRSNKAGLKSTGEHTHFAPLQTSHSRTGGGVAADLRSGVQKSDDESWRRTAVVHSVKPLWSSASPDGGGLFPGYIRGVLVRSLVGVRRCDMGPRVHSCHVPPRCPGQPPAAPGPSSRFPTSRSCSRGARGPAAPRLARGKDVKTSSNLASNSTPTRRRPGPPVRGRRSGWRMFVAGLVLGARRL